MRKIIAALATCVLVAGCSEEAPQQQDQQQRAELTPGEYEANLTVASLRSTDDSTPATQLEQSATGTLRACVAEGGEIDPALFAEEGDECSTTSSFNRNGRISMQIECRRADNPGQVLQSVNATSTAEGFEGEVSTTTYFSGDGDYEMARTVTATRLGDCPAGEPASGTEAQ